MTFRIFPDTIKEKDLPNYASSYQLEQLRIEVAKAEPDPERVNYFLNGKKYDRSIR